MPLRQDTMSDVETDAGVRQLTTPPASPTNSAPRCQKEVILVAIILQADIKELLKSVNSDTQKLKKHVETELQKCFGEKFWNRVRGVYLMEGSLKITFCVLPENADQPQEEDEDWSQVMDRTHKEVLAQLQKLIGQRLPHPTGRKPLPVRSVNTEVSTYAINCFVDVDWSQNDPRLSRQIAEHFGTVLRSNLPGIQRSRYIGPAEGDGGNQEGFWVEAVAAGAIPAGFINGTDHYILTNSRTNEVVPNIQLVAYTPPQRVTRPIVIEDEGEEDEALQRSE